MRNINDVLPSLTKPIDVIRCVVIKTNRFNWILFSIFLTDTIEYLVVDGVNR